MIPHNDNPSIDSLQNLLAELLFSSEREHTISAHNPYRESETQWRFEPGDFFDKWFREHGKAYFFLFRKNLKVTNIQFAELLSLIRSHNSSRESGQSNREIQFLAVADFYDAISEIVNSFPRDPLNPKARYELISQMYGALLARHVVLDYFFGSCAVFVPPNLEIDLARICAHSGYVHSCGTNVYTRKIEKAKKQRFFSALERHLSRTKTKQKPIFFMVYAHEDFTKNERPAKKEYLRDGLDDVKIYIEKFYMAAERLIDIVEEIKSTFAGKLLIPPEGESPGTAKKKNQECDQTRTLWLLVDYSIGAGIKQRGEDRFYICYDQQYLNESPFQLFDENKRAWLTPTTIPHTLLAAMMNLTEISTSQAEPRLLADPFVGTGTTWLEAIRIPHLVCLSTDKSAFAPLMARDNLDFFCRSVQELRDLYVDLEVVIEYLAKPKPHPFASASTRIINDYKWAISFYDRLVSDGRHYTDALEDPVHVDELSKQSPFRRLLFYLTLRTIGRSSISIGHGLEWDFAYEVQAGHLAGQLALLIEVRDGEENRTVETLDRFNLFQGTYSLSCTFGRDQLIDLRNKTSPIGGDGNGPFSVGIFNVLADADLTTSSLKPASCDVIITDPPYGFNTDDDLEGLAVLYSRSLETMIRALKDDGQLVLCLLDRSHTGRRSPYFTHKELITQQILSLAERMQPRREVIIPADAVPRQRDLFRPPYYWESERALRRAILHFRIRKL